MVLATRCPHCETVFRVQDALLARTHGRVRCGHCQEVFDASQNLLSPAAEEETGEHARAETMPEPHVPEPSAETPASDETGPAHVSEPAAGSEAATAAPEPARAEPPIENAIEVPLADAPTRHAAHAEQAGREMLNGGHRMNSVSHEVARDELREPTLSHPFAPVAEPQDETPQNEARREEPGPEAAHREASHRVEPEPPASLPHDEPRFAPHEPSTRWESDPEPSFHVPPQAEPGPSPSDAAAERFRMPPAPQADEDAHFAVTRERRASAPRHVLRGVLGTVLSLALAVLLIAQLAWWQRETVMVYWPGSQPLFARVCAQFGCLISPPRDIDGLQVEASDLRQIDGPHKLELRVPLRNRYSVALAYPAIELTLFDAKNEVAIRRVLWPQDYLPPGTKLANGLPPRTSQTMIVRLDSGNAVATNFRVQIFYP